MSDAARQFSEPIVLRHGKRALVRAIRPDDRERLQTAFHALEPESVYLRYFSYKAELTQADLDRLCGPDFQERVVLVVTTDGHDGVGPESGGDSEVIIGSGGYVAHTAPDGKRAAEVAFAVEEDLHGEGIASKLLAVLAGLARADGIARFEAEVLVRNAPMLLVFAHSGLPMKQTHSDDGVVSVTMDLSLADAPPSPAAASR